MEKEGTPGKHLLSKSTYIRGLQCEKSLYMYDRFIHLRDPLSQEQAAIFSRGNQVGMLARDLFPGGTDARAGLKTAADAVQKTRELMQEGADVIYEAAFQCEQVLVYLDILVRKNGRWHAYEVKSSMKVSAVYLQDAALQHYVITQSGLELEEFTLVYINSAYRKHGEIDLHGLFTSRNVTENCLARQAEIGQQLQRLKEVLALPECPDIPIGEQCSSPYPCDFMGHCWKQVPPDSVFNLTGANKTELFSMYHQGIRSIPDIQQEEIFNREQRIQIWSYKNRKAYASGKGLRDFFNGLTYPLYFLDVELFMPALPLYENSPPYQHIPYQYSLHCLEAPGAELKHVEFLAGLGEDPSAKFLLSLLENIGTKGSIIIYDDSAEKKVLKQLAESLPEYKAQIESIIQRFTDLMQVFLKRQYYSPVMKGGLSLKNVLPALVPGLDYSGLAISSGIVALAAFDRLQQCTDMFEAEELRKNLLEYCKMDTYAIYRVTEELRKLAG